MAQERQSFDESSRWWGEHLFRYEEALTNLSENSDVLDLACGNGFGTHLLAEGTTGIVRGADLSESTVAECQRSFQRKNLVFSTEDGTDLSEYGESFDVVVSFETIEHTTEFEKMIESFHSALRSGGKLILSTPNIVVNSPSGVVENPYHTQEFTYDELHSLLSGYFDQVEVFGQAFNRYKKGGFKIVFRPIESLLYLRGIRKIPLSIKNFMFKIFLGKQFYPTSTEFELISNKQEAVKHKTFFAICKKD